MLETVQIFTDGSCLGNPGVGGWAAKLILYRNEEQLYKILKGSKKSTTNNEMELTAVVEGLKAIKKPVNIEVYSDSAYVINTMTRGWIDTWVAKGWVSSTGQVVNRELWEQIYNYNKQYKIKWNKVKAHLDDANNNQVDCIARKEAEQLQRFYNI